MRILHCVESYFPSIGGMQEVVRQLSERLVKLGHQVTVATSSHPQRNFNSKQGVKIVQFQIEGNLASFITGDIEGYKNFLLNGEFDVITFFAAQQWATDIALPILKQIKCKKVSIPTGYSGFNWPEYRTYYENMKIWIKNFDMNVYLSYDYRDINFAKNNDVNKIVIIPNGAAADEFLIDSTIDIKKKLDIPENHFLCLHVGSYTGNKGHKEAIRIFLKSKIKQGTLLMIGNGHEMFYRQYIKHPSLFFLYIKNKLFGSKRIIFNAFSREFTVAAYKQANLFLFPSNIECSPIVLFESAAAKLPFLSSDAGNSKEISEWTGGGEIIPTNKDHSGYSHVDIKSGVRMLNEMYENESKRKQMANTAFINWQQKFSWEVITLEYEKLYLALLNQK